MTVTYSKEVCTCSSIAIFLKLLLRWRGSIYKIVWPDLLLYLMTYYGLKLLFIYGLTGVRGKQIFIDLVTYFSKYGSVIPLSFVLGFYVNIVYNRWWSQFCTIPEPDGIALQLSANVLGNEEKPRMIRRSIMRYTVLSFTMTLMMISPKIKKRFPSYQHLVHAGLLTNEEQKLLEEFEEYHPTYAKYWLPISWSVNLAADAKSEKLIEGEMGLKDIIDHLDKFREKCKMLTYYDWVCIPLVYTQVVTFAVYLYFLFTVIGEQFIEEKLGSGAFSNFRFPFMSCIEFFFYMGWLKVAESLINPFGDDDDDFDVNWMIDRHLQVGYWIVDKNQERYPGLIKDYHWDKARVGQMPFTMATRQYMHDHPVSSTSDIKLKQQEQEQVITDDSAPNENDLEGTSNFLGRLLFRKRRNSKVRLRKASINNEDEVYTI